MSAPEDPRPPVAHDPLLPPGRSMRSIVFTDVVGSTAMRDEHGDVAADAVRRDHDTIVGDVVRLNGGAVVKGTGDGLLAAFPSAAAALEATAAMQRALQRRNHGADVVLTIRVGAATGDVMVEDGDVFGTPVVEAARLCDLADGEEILATDLTVQLARSGTPVELGESGPRELKGLSAPVVVHEVLWRDLSASPVPLPTPLTPRRDERPFVGRDDEIADLRVAWADVVRGATATELIGGEPGLGKTRLVSELAREVHGEGAIVLLGQCEIDEGYPFRPFAEALRHHVTALAATGPIDPAATLGDHPGELTRLVPELPTLVGPLPDVTRSAPGTEEHRLFEAVRSWLASISRDRPLLLVIDDLQWASSATVAMLHHLLMSDDLSSVLVAATHRTEDIRGVSPVRSLLADLRRAGRPLGERMLDGIGAAAVETLVEASGDGVPAPGLVAQIVAGTGGNPFFVTELIDYLAAKPSGVDLDPGQLFETLPDRVVDVVAQRVERLSPETRAVLEAASVCGRRFEMATLAAALGHAQPDVLAGLEEASDADLIVDADGPRLAWSFRHALIRDAVRSELSTARRIRLHTAIASSLDEQATAGRPVDPETLAHHSAEAATAGIEVHRGVVHCEAAARQAADQLDHGQAAQWYERAIELIHAHGEADADLVFEVYLGHGTALKRADDPAGRAHLLDRTVAAARAAGGGSRLARAVLAATGLAFSALMDVDEELLALIDEALEAVDDDGLRARLLGAKALELTWAADDEIRFAVSDEAVALARRGDDPAVLAAVLGQRQITTWSPFTLDARLAETEELVALGRASADPYQLGQALRMRLHPLVESTAIAEARATLDEALELVGGLGQPELEAHFIHGSVELAVLRGDLASATNLTVPAVKRAAAEGDIGSLLLAGGTLVEIRRMQGRYANVLESLDMSAGATPDGDDGGNEPYMAARLRHQCGQVDQAAAIYEVLRDRGLEAIRIDTRTGPRWMDLGYLCARFEDTDLAPRLIERLEPHATTMFAPLVPYPVVSHVLGMLRALLGDDDGALADWETARAIAEGMDAPFFVDETRLEEARLRLRRNGPGDAEQAAVVLEEVAVTAAARGFGHLENDVTRLRDEFRLGA